MNIKNVLTQNGYENKTEQISEKILALDVNDCTKVRILPSRKEDLFDGFELSNTDDTISFIINLEDNEFAPLVKCEYDDELGVTETGYDNDCEIMYKSVDGDVVFVAE